MSPRDGVKGSFLEVERSPRDGVKDSFFGEVERINYGV